MNARPRWPWVIFGVAAIGAGVIIFAAPRVQRHIRSSGYCTSCHTDVAAHLGGHERTTCQSCHPLPEGETTRLVWAALSGGRGMPEHGELDEASCTTCHQRDERAWNALARTDGHSSHAIDPVLVDCVRCHSSGLHGEATEREGCESCHENTISRRDGIAAVECQRCHIFGARREGPEQAPAPGSWGSEISDANVHGSADCRLCHNPHRPEAQEEAASGIDCTSCHRGELARSITHAPENHQECGTCHRPHGLRTELSTACAVCHQAPRVRGETRDPGVPEEMREVTSIVPFLAARTGPPPPVPGVTHEGRCANCHEPHSWAPNAESCRECHEENAAKIDRFPPGTHRCMGCHEPHSPAPEGDACTECHTANASAMRAAPARHRDCLACHQAHEGEPNSAVVCGARCHQPQMTALRSGPTRHRTCANCHTPHGNPIAQTTARCQTCHAEQAGPFSRGNRHQTCGRCHSNHQFSGATALARCPTCHQAAVAPGASHPGQCVSCHTPHAPGRGRAANCASCHADRIQPRVAAHASNCAGCHQPHQPAATAAARCASCHTVQARAASAWRANIPHGANRCAECHTAHDEGRPRQCASCHANKANPTHMGPHPNCIGCHAPHVAPPAGTGPARWWQRCGTCHTGEARAAATARPEHQRCANCHDRPGRAAPTCQTCHTTIARVGMHQRPEHRNCTNCHATHGTTRPARSACLNCHQDRRNHFPDAPWCQSCHTFRSE